METSTAYPLSLTASLHLPFAVLMMATEIDHLVVSQFPISTRMDTRGTSPLELHQHLGHLLIQYPAPTNASTSLGIQRLQLRTAALISPDPRNGG